MVKPNNLSRFNNLAINQGSRMNRNTAKYLYENSDKSDPDKSFRDAYQNAKDSGRDLGLKGRTLRQYARGISSGAAGSRANDTSYAFKATKNPYFYMSAEKRKDAEDNTALMNQARFRRSVQNSNMKLDNEIDDAKKQLEEDNSQFDFNIDSIDTPFQEDPELQKQEEAQRGNLITSHNANTIWNSSWAPYSNGGIKASDSIKEKQQIIDLQKFLKSQPGIKLRGYNGGVDGILGASTREAAKQVLGNNPNAFGDNSEWTALLEKYDKEHPSVPSKKVGGSLLPKYQIAPGALPEKPSEDEPKKSWRDGVLPPMFYGRTLIPLTPDNRTLLNGAYLDEDDDGDPIITTEKIVVPYAEPSVMTTKLSKNLFAKNGSATIFDPEKVNDSGTWERQLIMVPADTYQSFRDALDRWATQTNNKQQKDSQRNVNNRISQSFGFN